MFSPFLKYSYDDLCHYYSILVSQAELYYEKNNYLKCIQAIQAAAFHQYHLNDKYYDENLDSLIKLISSKICKYNDNEVTDGVYLWYDSFSIDNRGLTQQYIDAILQIEGVKLLYISEGRISERGSEIKELLLNSSKCIKIVELECDIFKNVDVFYSILSQYMPEKVFLHLQPWSTVPFLALNLFKRIKKYQINLTDHAFWLGSTFVDYSFEFRKYGMRVSCEKRNLKEEQLFLLPYYPWINNKPFQGFPKETNGKLVIFSGGSLYKIRNKDNTYFFLIRDLLNINPNTIFLYAGSGKVDWLEKLVDEYGLSNRFFLLGERADICEVFRHCDIYVGTYPLAGGLMSQYAAIYKKPLLIYSSENDRSVEGIVCTKKYKEFSFFSKEEFLKEGYKLITDPVYRSKKGEFYSELIMGQTDFRETFKYQLSLSSNDEYHVSHECIDYRKFCLEYVEKLNEKYILGTFEVNFH